MATNSLRESGSYGKPDFFLGKGLYSATSARAKPCVLALCYTADLQRVPQTERINPQPFDEQKNSTRYYMGDAALVVWELGHRSGFLPPCHRLLRCGFMRLNIEKTCSGISPW